MSDETLNEKFKRFHSRNPHVYLALINLVKEVRATGKERVGIEMLMNQLRWNSFITTNGEDYKINQNFASRYARLIIAVHPEWDGMFEFRQLKTRG